MSDLIHIISWERFCQKNNLNDLEKYSQFLMQRYPGLLDIRNLNTKQNGPLLDELPENCLCILLEKCILLLDHRQESDSISGVDVIFKLLCLIARNNKNIDRLIESGSVNVVIKFIDLSMHKLAKEVDMDWLNLFEYLLYFMEIIYDPTFSWRRRKKVYYSEAIPTEDYSSTILGTAITNEVVTWMCSQLNVFSHERDIRNRLLHLLCSILSGSKHNAQLLISPAICDTFSFESDTNAEVIASFCFLITCLSTITTAERQEDLAIVVMKLLKFIGEKTELRIYELRCLSQLFDVNTELCDELIRCNIFSVIERCVSTSDMDKELCRLAFTMLSKLTTGSCEVRRSFVMSKGYDRMLDILNINVSRSAVLLDLVFSWAVCTDFDAAKVSVKKYVIRDGYVVGLMIRWSTRLAIDKCRDKESVRSMVDWKAIFKLLMELLDKSRSSSSQCCSSGVISIVCDCIKIACQQMDESVPPVMDYDDKALCNDIAISRRKCEDLLNGLFRLLDLLVGYSISGPDLVSIIRLFKDKHSRSRGRKIIKMFNNIVSEVQHHGDIDSWFELSQPDDCIMVYPLKDHTNCTLGMNINSFGETVSHKVLDTMTGKVNANSFSFHCWLNLSQLSVMEKVNSGHERSCIFRLLTEDFSGFEAFVNMDGQLFVATCHQGEFHYVQVVSKNVTKKSSFFIEENLLKYNQWHMLDLIFQNARNFFGRSTLTVYIDGALVNTVDLKYPVINQKIAIFHIGGCRKSVANNFMSTVDIKTRRKAGFLSTSGPKRTWLGEEHNVWGRLSSLKCRMVAVACLNDALTDQTITILYSRGPMSTQALVGDDQLNGSIIVNYHSLAFNPVDNTCQNLHPYIQSSKCAQHFCGYLLGERLSSLRLEVVINEIGGVSALLPIIEQLEFMQVLSVDDLDNEDGYRFEDDSSSKVVGRMVSSNCDEDGFISVADRTSDELLDDSILATLVILLRKLTSHSINHQQMERTKCIEIIGGFLQKIETIFLDMNVVIAFHAMADQCGEGFIGKIYQLILLDWRIWSRCDNDTRHKHCVFIANLVKHERSYFRKNYGVGFFLDVIRLYHGPHVDNGVDVNKRLRREIFELIYGLLRNHATIGDYQKMVKFIHESDQGELIQELLELFTKLYESSTKSDQDCLLMYENKLLETLYVLLIKDVSTATKEDTIKFLNVLISSDRVSNKQKNHLLLADISFASIFIYKEFYQSPISSSSIHVLLHILQKAAAKDLFGVIQFLSLLTLSPIEQRISAMKMLKSFFDKSPDTIFAISKQPGWQDILVHLLVSQKRNDQDHIVSNHDVFKPDEVQLRQTDINSNETGFRRSSTWIFNESDNDNCAFTQSKFDEIVEEDEDFPVSDSITEKSPDELQELKSVDTLFLKTRSAEDLNAMNADDDKSNLRSDIAQQRSMCCSFSEGDELPNLSKKSSDVWLDTDYKEDVDPTAELIDLILRSLHQVIWSVITSADNELVWMTVHQVMESFRSVNERYTFLKPMFYFKQQILIGLLNSTINTYRSNDVTMQPSVTRARELIRLVVDSCCLISTTNTYQYETELIDLMIVLLQDCLHVWDEDSTYPELAALGFFYLLTLSCSHDMDIVAAVCARLHQIITTLSKNITYDEVAFILIHLDRILRNVIDSDNYYFIAPILKTVLEQNAEMLQISMYLPNLSNKTPEFYDYFKVYSGEHEWRTFVKSRLLSAYEVYESSYLNSMTASQSLWRAQANEQMSLDRKKRAAIIVEHKKLFETKIINHTITWIKEERRRNDYKATELQIQHDTALKQWRTLKQFLVSNKGCWHDEEAPAVVHLKQSCRENYLRMRPRFDINYQFDSHLDASNERDHPRRSLRDPEPDPMKCLSALEVKIDFSALGDDQLGDDEWSSIENIEQTDVTSSPKLSSGNKKSLFECRCKLIAFTEVVDGRFELTSTNFIFQGNNASADSLDSSNSKILCSIIQIREVHLRRYNLRRSAIEIFLTDQTNYFFNFDTNLRDKVYSKILSLRPPNLVYSKQRSPADMLRNSGLTQKWINREISNFEYLMQLNTIAGRTYNDLSQYPVFPWIIADYTSPKLDLNNPKTFRDLSKPIGIVNPKNEEEVREKYETFEDPGGVIAKFHYGTHYSSAAGVMHYLVRMEPFTTMHIQLQSGKFDVADRQFHSIPLSWNTILESPNDNKELIPEFFYQPQFLKNENNFNFGLLQHTMVAIDDVELPTWANSPEDFIYQHRQALESEYVSMNLHNWIDLIFGYKQKGIEAVKALNVFYYVTYEGVVDLDQIEDRYERESIESMINNFGQTPCQLLKHPHPRRMSSEEVKTQMIKVDKYLHVMPNIRYLKHTSKSISSVSEPITFIRVPLAQNRGLMGQDRALSMITIHSSNVIAKHNWTPNPRGVGSGYYIDIDPVFDSPTARRRNYLGPLNSCVTSKNQLYVVTPDCKFIIAGGNIENRLVVMPLSKKLDPLYPTTPHHRPITCVTIDIDTVVSSSVSAASSISGIVSLPVNGYRLYGMSGSVDSTCTIWDWSDLPSVSVLHVLSGHCDPIVSVSLSVYLDIAASGSQDGTVNLHSVSKGQFLHSIIPGGLTPTNLSVNYVVLDRIGHVYIQWQNCSNVFNVVSGSQIPELSSKYPKQFLSLYSLHTNHLATDDLGYSKVNVVSVVPKSPGSLDTCVIVGNSKGELAILDGYDLTELHLLRFSESILDANVLSSNGQYLSVALSNGQLIISAVCLTNIDT